MKTLKEIYQAWQYQDGHDMVNHLSYGMNIFLRVKYMELISMIKKLNLIYLTLDLKFGLMMPPNLNSLKL